MYNMDYDTAASHWIEKDKNSVHMEEATLRETIEAFINAHNTCALATASGTWCAIHRLNITMWMARSIFSPKVD